MPIDICKLTVMVMLSFGHAVIQLSGNVMRMK